jgi:hypothetical protein
MMYLVLAREYLVPQGSHFYTVLFPNELIASVAMVMITVISA